MDMSNATAAGPSYGILDVIFGKAPKEVNEADGQGFGGLMELIKSLNKGEKDEEENPLGGNRTDQENASGKSMIDYRAVGIPGQITSAALLQIPVVDPNSGEKTQLLMGSKSALMQNPALSNLEKVDLAEVNRLLSEKSLPALSEDELSLLNDVNGKLKNIQSPRVSEKEPVNPKAAILAQLALDPKLQKELEKRGIADGKISSVETKEISNGAAPETFMNTEMYLSMHGKNGHKSLPKNIGNEESVDAKLPTNSSPILAAANEQNPNQTNNSGKEDLFNQAERDVKLQKSLDNSLKGDEAVFADTLGQSVKGSSAGKKDIYLNSAKPEEMKQALMGEVTQNVNANALKGGGEMRLVIHPEELGEVKIKVASKQGKIEVQVTAKNEEVASLIRSGSKDLEGSLNAQNLSLARFEVTVSDTAVVSTDTKSSLADQFLSQHNSPNQGNMQSNSNSGDDRSFNSWEGQSQRQSSSEFLASERQKSQARSHSAGSRNNYSPRNGSGRLDVVA